MFTVGRKKKIIILVIVIVLLITMAGIALAQETSYSVGFVGTSQIYSGTHIYTTDDTVFYDNNSYAQNFSGSRAYCSTHGTTASYFVSPDGSEPLYSSHREDCKLRFKAYSSSTSTVCTASGRYGAR